MNRLAWVEHDRFLLPRHAHLVVYDGNDRELLTIYDCGAAQKPPTAQLLGTLGRISCRHELTRTPTGYVVRLQEPAILERQDTDDFRILSRDTYSSDDPATTSRKR